MTLITARPRRSILYMPGTNAKALERAKTLPTDGVILDLEDAVAPEAKEEARVAVARMVKAGGYGNREVIIRVNALNSPWGPADLEAAIEAGPDAILFPKLSTSLEVIAAHEAMEALGARPSMNLWAMIETPRAILEIASIASASTDTRLSTFVMGTNDLAKETRARLTPDRTAFHYALSASVTAARLYGLTIIDGVYNDISNVEGFAEMCWQGLNFGFDGKTLIHPSQLETCNTIFAPSAEEVAHARAVIAAFADPANAGKGVLKVDGKMTELLHLEMAQRTFAIAEAIHTRALDGES
ncbi:HpcH/HpaI aldolase/citrate lyase family protein [Candidatus Phycosocius spiralis]|uniref:Citrate lyase subunit beta n=1 Tax=Candidatus Phycosocius spiralis TaxID=2815099 RepID=A0ABQ4PTT7_9PROT|nr:CoA ester lyase [Candidatus Phycosocius spiralis]GIU66400.1 citrate lyase subunit beta [Candidatus Phycosocius spiralis]